MPVDCVRLRLHRVEGGGAVVGGGVVGGKTVPFLRDRKTHLKPPCVEMGFGPARNVMRALFEDNVMFGGAYPQYGPCESLCMLCPS